MKQRISGTGPGCRTKWRRKLIYGNNLLVLLYCKNGDKDETLVMSSCFRTILKIRAGHSCKFNFFLFWILFFVLYLSNFCTQMFNTIAL